MSRRVEVETQGPRAVAVVCRDHEVLVIKRHYQGTDYAVLPGGSVEAGETFEHAALRELWEESTLRATDSRERASSDAQGASSLSRVG